MGLHKCPKCKVGWICLDTKCEYEGEEHICPICTAREIDCDPFTRVKYPGAFKEWEELVK